MAVEIKELVIKATVAGQSPAGNPVTAKDETRDQEIVNQCVSEVLKILQREKER
jgi:hypothetical protein